MRAVKGRATTPERQAAALLRSVGAPFRKNVTKLPGSPDLVVRGAKIAIFVHGCWWHGHTCPRGARVPQHNRPYWVAKIARNRRRDRRAARQLRARGYSVWTLWECRLRQGVLPTRLLNHIEGALQRT